MSSVEEILERMRTVCGVKTDRELAKILHISASSVISSWKSRGRKPYAECEFLAAEMGISMDWLLTGKGPIKRGAPPQAEEISRATKMLIKLMRDMSEEEQEQVLRRVEERKQAVDDRRKLAEALEAIARLKDEKRLA